MLSEQVRLLLTRRDFLRRSVIAASPLDRCEKIFPGLRENFEGGASFCWDEDEWARGAYSILKPREMFSLLPHVARPEGRVHFAGEHASAWPGWMQGALESGNRAAKEINSAAYRPNSY
jgi:monoamine oxidase